VSGTSEGLCYGRARVCIRDEPRCVRVLVGFSFESCVCDTQRGEREWHWNCGQCLGNESGFACGVWVWTMVLCLGATVCVWSAPLQCFCIPVEQHGSSRALQYRKRDCSTVVVHLVLCSPPGFRNGGGFLFRCQYFIGHFLWFRS
jgi:hypothetical protein